MTQENIDISVVVPFYNEGENAKLLYKELRQVLDKLNKKYEIIFIDDGSTDLTFEILRKINLIDKNFKVIKFRKNFGQTAALNAGFKYAKGNLIIAMDGDLQNDPNDIPKLLKKIEEGYDVVSGWRFERKDSIGKKLFSKISNLLRRKMMNDQTHDAGCALKVYKKEAVKEH